jgi:phage/plasmid-like protein (TIGR03299 family)
MAHELAFDATGTARMFSVRETPWHREGHVLSDAPTFDDALALAGHNFEVEVRPAFRRIEVAGVAGVPGIVDYVASDNARITVRTDTGAELGAVGTGYHAIQNRDAFAVLTPLLDAGVATLETGGTLRGGADVWLQAKFDLAKFGPIAQRVLGDEVEPFALIANNHNGRRGCLLSLTPIRVVCANTLGMSENMSGAGNAAEHDGGKAIIVRHTENHGERLVTAAEKLFHSVVARYETIARHYEAMKARYLTNAEFAAAVLDVIAPDPRAVRTWNPEAKLADVVVRRCEAKRATLTRLWTDGTGHAGDFSAWEAYNAAVEAIDHDVDGLFPLRGGVYRTASLLDGTYATMKAGVLHKVTKLLALAV